MEVKKKIKDLPQVEDDPRFLQLVKDYKCKYQLQSDSNPTFS